MGGKGWTGHTFQPCTAVGLFHIIIQRCEDLLSRKGKDLLRLCSLITRFCQSYICLDQSRGIKLNQVLEKQEGQVEELEDKLRHLTLAYPITMARPGGGVSLNSSSVSR